MRPIDRDMKGNNGRTKYIRLSFLQEVVSCFINIFFSFLKFLKIIFLYLLHSNEYHKATFIYPSLKIVDTLSSCIVDPEQDPSPESYDNHTQSFEPHETKPGSPSHVLNPIPSQIPEKYRPLKLSYILHYFPPKHHKYMLKFGGEPNKFYAKKHIQDFEHFIDLFEIDHDDVCMRELSQSLKGNNKDWFKHLHPKTISSWEELKNVFLKFWGKKKYLDLQLTKFYALKR